MSLACPLPSSLSLVSIWVSRWLFQHLGLERRGLMWQSLMGRGKPGLAEGCVVQPASRGPGEPGTWLPILSTGSPGLPAEDPPLP